MMSFFSFVRIIFTIAWIVLMAIILTGILSAKVSSVSGVQASYLPFQCELSHEGGKHVLSLTNDDGSGDLERRVFIMSEAKVDMRQKGSVPAINITTRSGAVIKLQFSNKEAQSRWFIALNRPPPIQSKANLLCVSVVSYSAHCRDDVSSSAQREPGRSCFVITNFSSPSSY